MAIFRNWINIEAMCISYLGHIDINNVYISIDYITNHAMNRKNTTYKFSGVISDVLHSSESIIYYCLIGNNRVIKPQ